MICIISMSGHSKWATIKRQKALTDKKRGALFSKISNVIAITAREGSDPSMNFKLRLAIEQAKSINMPRDVIERAIWRGSKKGEETLEEILYEGFGPSGIALLIEVLTSNRNRTTAELRHLFNIEGGTLGRSGATQWMFERKGVIKILNFKLQISDLESFELKTIDVGVQDIKKEEEELTIFTKPEDLQKVKEYLEKEKIKLDYTGLEWFAKNPIKIDQETSSGLEALTSALDDHPDVTDYYTNVA